MRAYIIRRVLLMIPTMFVVTLVIFTLIRLVPGSAVDEMAVRLSGQGIDIEVARAEIMHRMGLDAPIPVQYGRWLGLVPQADGNFSGIFQGDLGQSFWRPYTVVEEIARRWPVTVSLGLMALIIAQIIALPIGIYSALRQDTWGDYIARSFGIMCIAVPGFWLATMIIVFPSIWWGYSIPLGRVPLFEDPLRAVRMYIVPATVLGMGMAGAIMRMTRTMMLEVLRQDYIRTAWAKGLRERVVVMRHALKNALIPVVTIVGMRLPVLIGGTVIIETIFSLPGMGLLIVTATKERDYAVLSGSLLFFSLGLMLINLVVDLTYAFLDPRVRYK